MIELGLWLFSAWVVASAIIWFLSVLIKMRRQHPLKSPNALKPWIRAAVSIFPIGGLEVANALIPPHPDDRQSIVSMQYLYIAVQYYLAGRTAVFARSLPVAGNLFHHAIEMFLKYFLLEHGETEASLKRKFGHNLKKLWKAFKTLSGDNTLSRFNALVSELNTVEDLRYPGKGYTFIMEEVKTRTSEVPSSGEYRVNLEEMDEFVTTLLSGRITPEFFSTLLIWPDAKSQYKRENRHLYGFGNDS